MIRRCSGLTTNFQIKIVTKLVGKNRGPMKNLSEKFFSFVREAEPEGSKKKKKQILSSRIRDRRVYLIVTYRIVNNNLQLNRV